MKEKVTINQIQEEMCDCYCHNDDVEYMHMFPCCSRTYEKRSGIEEYAKRRMGIGFVNEEIKYEQ